MKLKIAANCIRGNKRRSNEDMVLVGESFLRDGSIDFSLDNPDLFFALVSDGMGGHDHGEMASEFLLGRIRESILPATDVGGGQDPFCQCRNGVYLEQIGNDQAYGLHLVRADLAEKRGVGCQCR